MSMSPKTEPRNVVIECDRACCGMLPRGNLTRAMSRSRNKPPKRSQQVTLAGYDVLLADVARVVEEARCAAARSVNTLMTTTYWLVGRHCRFNRYHRRDAAGVVGHNTLSQSGPAL